MIECLFYFAVPLFFMVTGVTLIDYRERYDTKEYFKKRIKKAVIPFIAWSLFGIFYNIVIKFNESLSSFSFITTINAIMETTYVSIYWFFIPLFCIYLCIPLFSAIDKKLKNNVFIYLLIICLIFNCIIPFIINTFNLNLTIPITITVGSEYLLYVIIGYLLHNNKINAKLEAIIYILGIIGLLTHIIGTYKLSMESLYIVSTYKGYNNLPCILYSSAVFLFIKNITNYINNKKFYKIINQFKNYTFAIYLLHWYFLDIFTTVFKLNTNSLIFCLGTPILVIPFCISITYTLRKIPLIKHIVP